MIEKSVMTQPRLFDDEVIVAGTPGLMYERGSLTCEEEASIIEIIQTQPLRAAKHKEYFARRRVVSFSGSYDFDTNELLPAHALDTRLRQLRDRVARWGKVTPESSVHALVAE